MAKAKGTKSSTPPKTKGGSRALIKPNGSPHVAVAVIRLTGPAQWSREGRGRIAKWLRKQADFLTKSGHEMSRTFTARYLVPEGDEP